MGSNDLAQSVARQTPDLKCKQQACCSSPSAMRHWCAVSLGVGTAEHPRYVLVSTPRDFDFGGYDSVRGCNRLLCQLVQESHISLRNNRVVISSRCCRVLVD